jgi:nucleotide-binding universal stress UspA family protein
MYACILVPLDGSRLAECVLPAVERLAGGDTCVVLLHVLERSAPAEVHGERHLRAEAEALDYLRGVAARLEEKGVRSEFHFHDAPEGDVARSIAAHAEEKRADLIALSTHGRGRVRDRLFGTIAQRVLGSGATPVLLVRPPDDGACPPFEPRMILVPLDGTRTAEAALKPAEMLAQALEARVHLVRVVASEDSVRGDRPEATLLPSATRAVLDLECEAARTYLDGVAETRISGDPVVSWEVSRGSVAPSLAEAATEPGIGLIVMATHGRSGLQALWSGSVAAQVLGRTRVPVLLIRAEPQPTR